MKKIIFLLIAGLCIFSASSAWAKLPQNYQEFKTRYQTEGRTIEGAFKLHLEAIFCYINKKTRKEASKMLRYSMHLQEPLESSRNQSTFVKRMIDPEYNYVFRSYCAGTSPQNNYQMSPDNFYINFAGYRQEQDFVRLFVQSSGADSKTHIWMKNYDGLWYTTNNSSLYVMIREPQEEIDKRRNRHDADYDGKPVSSTTNSTTNTYVQQPIDINALLPQSPVGSSNSSQKQHSSQYNSNSSQYNSNSSNSLEQTITRAIREVLPRTNRGY